MSRAITAAPASVASSALNAMSVRECEGDSHHSSSKRRKLLIIIFAILTFLILATLAILITYAILHPHRPRFVLQDSILYTFKLEQPTNTLTASMQVTISSKNCNDAIGVLYEKLEIYATYKNQQFTESTALPRTYLGHKDVAMWSPFLNGSEFPVNVGLVKTLTEDSSAGMTFVDVKIDGKVKWKVGSWVSTVYRIHVNCPAYILLGSQNNASKGGRQTPAFRDQFVKCSVDV